MTDPSTLIYQAAEPRHRETCRVAWLEAMASSPWAQTVTPPDLWKRRRASAVYWSGHHDLIDRALERGSLLVASWPEDLWTVVGFVAHDAPAGVLHMLAVKPEYRRLGIGRELVRRAGLDRLPRVLYTQRSRICNRIAIPGHWTYDPYPLILGGT